ncbi:cytochrome b [Nocardioides astragali]|uniref:Cytochrome b n=1 Tax=Nocardioides astragali TaxID=1776736 RepID=A0ABW2N716_9ACTN|nr:cytochrome b/b6 domain-containing protein [Nocardioides astragali]
MTALRPTGYHPATKALHWLTVLALATQFAVGYQMDANDSGRGRGRGESGRGRGRGGESGGYLDDPDILLKVHVALGLTILGLAVARVGWRRVAGLPPWAEQLRPTQRRVATWTERVLLMTLFVIPLSGLALVAAGDDDLVWLHVTGHVLFLAALLAHLGLVAWRGLLPRMLPAT